MTPPVAGADFLAALVASCFLGKLSYRIILASVHGITWEPCLRWTSEQSAWSEPWLCWDVLLAGELLELVDNGEELRYL